MDDLRLELSDYNEQKPISLIALLKRDKNKEVEMYQM